MTNSLKPPQCTESLDRNRGKDAQYDIKAIVDNYHSLSACNAGDTGDVGLIPGLGRSPGGGNGNPF